MAIQGAYCLVLQINSPSAISGMHKHINLHKRVLWGDDFAGQSLQAEVCENVWMGYIEAEVWKSANPSKKVNIVSI